MPSRAHWILLAFWVVGCFGAAALAAAGWLPVSHRLDWRLQAMELVALAGFGGLFLLAGAGLLLGFFSVVHALVARRGAALLYLVPLSLPVVLMAAWVVAMRCAPPHHVQVREAEFSALAERSRALTDALARYAEDHERSAPSLEALVPDYLPEVPATGIDLHPLYRYRVFADGIEGGRLLWYGLGSSADDWYDDWRYVDLGPATEGILVVVLDAQGLVVGTDTDRLGSAPAPRSFDATRWRDDEDEREGMLEEIRPRLIGLTLEETRALLGREDGQAELERHGRGAPYELLVHCPSGPMNWDVFVYWPSESYPDTMQGGWVERIGGWAYVHE